ncbi:MAG TPA: C25 family cysteine peptidase, partial [Pyrinomonadaceae bacterium]
IEDVYDEFSYGIHKPEAIRDFLKATAARWTKAPRFVLLMGDATYDARNYTGKGDLDFVPSKLVDTVYTECSSDDWLADLNEDGVPEMAVGRLPAMTTAQADVMVSKITGYNPSAVQATALFVADAQGSYPFSFEQENSEISVLLPPSVTIKNVNLDTEGLSAARTKLFNEINQGPMIVNYAGHGTIDAWSGAALLTSSDVNSQLSNGNHLPLFVMMTCLNGYFNDPLKESLAETLIKAQNGGGVAVWASSGLTVPYGQALMNRQLYQLLFSSNPPTLGEAVQQAKAATDDRDVQLTWVLFGDPTMKLR